MDGQERIIRRLFMEQQCHRCGHPYEPKRVLVLARRSDLWMVMISCGDCEQKDTYVVKFTPHMQGRLHVTSYRLSKPPTMTPLPEEPQQTLPELPETPRPSASPTPVNTDDVLDMYLFLKDFNGDFQQLFTKFE